MNPAIGEEISSARRLHKNFYDAILSYGTATGRAPAVTIVEHNGRLTIQLTYENVSALGRHLQLARLRVIAVQLYKMAPKGRNMFYRNNKHETTEIGKLLSRSCKIAYWLLMKAFRSHNEVFSLKFGDPVALVYTQNDPINFVCAFYGCLFAELVPIPVEPPLSRSDGVTKETGDLLRKLGVRVCLTSDVLSKCLAVAWGDTREATSSWTGLYWMSTQHLPRPPRDWKPDPHLSADRTAYIEVTSGRENMGTRGLNITHSAMMTHCRGLSTALGHAEGETMVCLVETRRGPGLWHAVFSGVLNGLHTVVIAKPVADSNPTYWMHLVAKYRASIALVTCRDLERCLLADVNRPGVLDHHPVNLSPLRLLVVCDAANPWSFPVCDNFLDEFADRGLRPEVVCPTATSPECLTVSIKRPTTLRQKCRSAGSIVDGGMSTTERRPRTGSSDRFHMELHCGQVLPGSSVAVVKLDGRPELCGQDEVGEICVAAGATAKSYVSKTGTPPSAGNVFGVLPLDPEDGSPATDTRFTRSGLIGFLREDGYVYVCGSVSGLLVAGGRRHNADDVVATVAAAISPPGSGAIASRGQIAVFTITPGASDEGKLVVVARQHPDWDHDKNLRWMLKVLHAVDSLHHVSAYCVALVPDHHLPRTSGGEVNTAETKRRFLEGSLHPGNIILYSPRLNNPEIKTGSIGLDKSGQFGSGKRKFLQSTEGPSLCLPQNYDESNHHYKSHFLLKILEWRSTVTSDEVIFTQLNGKSVGGSGVQTITWSQLFRGAASVGSLVLERAVVNPGEARVAVIFQPGIQLVTAFYACLYIGAVPIVIRPPDPENPSSFVFVERAIAMSGASVVLADTATAKVLKSKAASESSRKKRFLWPVIVNAEETPKKYPPPAYKHTDPTDTAYIDFNLGPTGRLTGIEVTHLSAASLSQSLKTACELYSLRPVLLCLDPYSGLGLALWCLTSVFSGHHSILIPPTELESNPSLWLAALSQHRVRDTFCSYEVMGYCTEELKSSVESLKTKLGSLRNVRWCIAVGGCGRARQNVLANFSRTFAPLGLKESAVAASFGCRANVAISVQNASSREPMRIYVDRKELRNDRVRIVKKSSADAECLVESGQLLPAVRLAVVNPETGRLCSSYHIGEIWVDSEHNTRNYVSPRRVQPISKDNVSRCSPDRGDTLRMVLADSDHPERQYARTGYLGFVLELDQESTETLEETDERSEAMLHPYMDNGAQQAVFIVGALDEIVTFKGLRYHHIFNKP